MHINDANRPKHPWVTGTIGARNQGRGIVGIAPGVGIYALRVLQGDGNGVFSDLLRAYDHLIVHGIAAGVRVVNLSLSGGGDASDEECSYVARLLELGMTVVTAAGTSLELEAGNDITIKWFIATPSRPAVFMCSCRRAQMYCPCCCNWLTLQAILVHHSPERCQRHVRAHWRSLPWTQRAPCQQRGAITSPCLAAVARSSASLQHLVRFLLFKK
jgi:subtilisin family serine protease